MQTQHVIAVGRAPPNTLASRFACNNVGSVLDATSQNKFRRTDFIKARQGHPPALSPILAANAINL